MTLYGILNYLAWPAMILLTYLFAAWSVRKYEQKKNR